MRRISFVLWLRPLSLGDCVQRSKKSLICNLFLNYLIILLFSQLHCHHGVASTRRCAASLIDASAPFSALAFFELYFTLKRYFSIGIVHSPSQGPLSLLSDSFYLCSYVFHCQWMSFVSLKGIFASLKEPFLLFSSSFDLLSPIRSLSLH